MAPSTIDPRDERHLLLLGLLSTQSQHGYQINEFIDRNLARLSRMRKATAYALLNRLAESGLADTSTTQRGNRPARRVYAITPAGADLLVSMLEGILAEPATVEPPGDIALMFIDHLDRDVAVAAIARRIDALDAEIAGLERMPPHEVGIGVDLAVARRLALLRADRAWFAWALKEATARLPEVGGPVPNPPPHREPDRDRAADMPGVEGADR